MALEQVLSDHDSEDEVDDDIADLEDRRVSRYLSLITVQKHTRIYRCGCCLELTSSSQASSLSPTIRTDVLYFKLLLFPWLQMLADFLDVTKDEKLIMHMWNSFIRKQR